MDYLIELTQDDLGTLIASLELRADNHMSEGFEETAMHLALLADMLRAERDKVARPLHSSCSNCEAFGYGHGGYCNDRGSMGGH